MHASLYAVLAGLVMISFNRPVKRSSLGFILLITLVVGVLQEGWQMLSGVQIMDWNTCLDLGIDLLGSLIGYGFYAMIYWLRTKSRAY